VPTCTGKSIGFVPLNVRPATSDEVARRPELRGVPMIDRWAGVEYAVVPVPCNPEAEMQAVAKGMELGMIDDALRDLIAESAPAPMRATAGSRVKFSRERIRALVLGHMQEALASMCGRVA